mgnify:CR=1 FL=1
MQFTLWMPKNITTQLNWINSQLIKALGDRRRIPQLLISSANAENTIDKQANKITKEVMLASQNAIYILHFLILCGAYLTKIVTFNFRSAAQGNPQQAKLTRYSGYPSGMLSILSPGLVQNPSQVAHFAGHEVTFLCVCGGEILCLSTQNKGAPAF